MIIFSSFVNADYDPYSRQPVDCTIGYSDYNYCDNFGDASLNTSLFTVVDDTGHTYSEGAGYLNQWGETTFDTGDFIYSNYVLDTSTSWSHIITYQINKSSASDWVGYSLDASLSWGPDEMLNAIQLNPPATFYIWSDSTGKEAELGTNYTFVTNATNGVGRTLFYENGTNIANYTGTYTPANHYYVLFGMSADVSIIVYYLASWNGTPEDAPYLVLVSTSVVLNSPANDTTNTSLAVNFLATPTSGNAITNCSLWNNDTSWSMKALNNSDCDSGVACSFNDTFNSDGSYLWNVECCDGITCAFGTDNYTLEIEATLPEVTDVVWITTGGYTDGIRLYNQIIDEINVTCSDINLVNCTLDVVKPSGVFEVNNILMSNISSNFNYSSNIILDEAGTWIINVTGRDVVGNIKSNFTTVEVVITSVTIFDGFYSYDYESIPLQTIIDENFTAYAFDSIGMTMGWSNLNDTFTSLKTIINESKESNNIKSFIRLYFEGNYSSLSTYTNVTCVEVNANLTDFKIGPYDEAIIFILIDLNDSQTNNVNFTNSIAECIVNATENIFPVYVDYADSFLDTNWVSTFDLIRFTATNNATYVNLENNFLTNSTSLTRIYYNLSKDIRVIAKKYHDDVITMLRGTPTTTVLVNNNTADISNGDVVVFNNQSSTQTFLLNVSSVLRDGKDVWDSTEKTFIWRDMYKNISVNISPYSFSNIYFDDIDHLTLTGVYGGITDNINNYGWNETGDTPSAYSIVGANDAMFYAYDPTYKHYNQFFIHYEWINTSYVTNYSAYCDNGVVIMADYNSEAINNTINCTEKTFGYISVADYNDTDAWVVNKNNEIDVWIDDFSINVFLDGLDSGAAGSNFATRFTDLINHIEVTKNSTCIANDYTSYSDVGVGGLCDYDMKESFCGRWSGTVGSPTYSWETWNVDYDRAVWARTNNNPQLLMTFGDKLNTSKQMYCYAMYLVLYGTSNNNLYKYGQPNFQSQQEIFTFDPGAQLENTWTEVNASYYYRKYGNGLVWINPTTYEWNIENNRVMNNLSLSFQMQIYAGAPAASTSVAIDVNGNALAPITYDEVSAVQWGTNTVPRDITSLYDKDGKYAIRLHSSLPANPTGINLYKTTKNKTGVFSFWDNSVNNPPVDGSTDWNVYGRSGVNDDYETDNWQINLISNDSTSFLIDDGITDILQTNITISTGIRTNITVNATKDYNITIWGDAINISNYNNLTYWNGTKQILLNPINTSTCESVNPIWNSDTIESEIHQSCIYNTGVTLTTVRVALPSLSSRVYQINQDDLNAPSIILGIPINNSTQPTKTITFIGNATEAVGTLNNCSLYTNETSWSLKVTNTTCVSGENCSINNIFTTDGNYLWNYECCDDVGNCGFSVSNFSLTIDTSPPAWVIIPDNASLEYLVDSLNVDFNATDASGVDSYFINDSDFIMNISTGVLENNTNLALGTYYINVSVNDTFGFLNSLLYRVNVFAMVVNITPTYPNYTSDIHCQFNVSEFEINVNKSVNITWFKNETVWENVDTYDYTYTNITLETLYTTTAGTGSVTETLAEGSEWKCQVHLFSDGINYITKNSSFVLMSELQNLTVYSPPNNTLSNEPIEGLFSVYDEHEDITCNLNFNDSTSFSYDDVLSGINHSLNSTNISKTSTGIFNDSFIFAGISNQSFNITINKNTEILNGTIALNTTIEDFISYLEVGTPDGIYEGFYVDEFCYQETANISNFCGGLNTGIYSSVSGSIYINYTKPNFALGALWQTKHGNVGINNFTIPDSCWQQDVLALEMRSRETSCSGEQVSRILCLNDTGWQLLNESSGGCIAGSFNIDEPPGRAYDGDWNTYSTWHASLGWGYFSSGGNPNAWLWEEGIWWNYSYTGYIIEDLTISINDAINNSACDCTGCILSENDCQVPFLVYSNKSGTVEYSNISIYVGNYYPDIDGDYLWNLSCNSISDPESIFTENYLFIYDTTPPYFVNETSNDNSTYPEIGDRFNTSIIVSDIHNVSYCELYANDTGIYIIKDNTTVNDVSLNITLGFVIGNWVKAQNDSIGYYYSCNDSLNNLNVSTIYSFIVQDITPPSPANITGINVTLFNNSVISNFLTPTLLINFTFYDENLFQASVNVSCDVNQSLYYWEILDINSSNYTHQATIQIGGNDLQKCYMYYRSSDDHTKEKIPKYKKKELAEGLEFETENDALVKIMSNDGKVKNVNSRKKDDRHTFEFEFEDKKLEREFTVSGDVILYPQEDSEYPGHFVAWNKNKKRGNWIDFDEPETDYIYEIGRVNDKEYTVKIKANVPKDFEATGKTKGLLGTGDVMTLEEEILDTYGIDEFEFESIGGTIVYNESLVFYIGGYLNMTARNVYDNETISDFCVSITSITAAPFNNTILCHSGTSINHTTLPNGSYSIFFNKTGWMNNTYIFNINVSNQTLEYATSHGIINIIVRNVKSLEYLTNLNITLNNTDVGKLNFIKNNYSTVSTFAVNASDYNFTVDKIGFISFNSSTYTLSREQNLTIIVDMSFLASFVLFDERTLELFNMSSADTISFLLFCPTSTFTTIINVTTITLPIICSYTKFKFVLDYGSSSYYRTFIFTPAEAFNQSIYLIDLTTTSSIYNSLILDDLLQDYDNPSIYVKKIINDETALIMADYVDIENKIGAYLIESHEYIIEVHSDNNPTRVMGFYSADIAGEKVLRLYDIGLYLDEGGFMNDVNWDMRLTNVSGTSYIVAAYEDRSNDTTELTFTVWADEWNETQVFTDTITLAAGDVTSSAEFIVNVTAYLNTTLLGEFNIVNTQRSVVQNVGKVLYEVRDQIINLGQYLGAENGQVFFNWLVTILLSIIAIYATMQTANKVGFIVLGLGLVLRMFGLYTISLGIIVLAILITLATTLKKGDRLA